MTSMRAMALASSVFTPKEPLRRGVDCGTPSIIINGARPRSVCPELLELPVSGARPGTICASKLPNSELTFKCCCICC